MKKLITAILMLAAISGAFAQGSFNAHNFGGGGNVYANSTGTLAGSDYFVQVFWGLLGTSENALTPIGAPTALFGVTGGAPGSGAGWFDLGTLDLMPGQATGPASVLVQYRGTGFGFIGRSVVVVQPIGFAPNLPGDPANTGDWWIFAFAPEVPEPSTLTLAGLGALGMLSIRRRK